MLPTSAHFSVPFGLAFQPRLTAFVQRVACLLFATALLLVGNGRAQEKSARIDILIQQMRSPDKDVRRSVAEALGKIGPAAKEAVPALIEALKDPDIDVRRSVAEALGEIGPEAKGVVPALIEALKDQEAGVRSSVRMALEKIESAPKKP